MSWCEITKKRKMKPTSIQDDGQTEKEAEGEGEEEGKRV